MVPGKSSKRRILEKVPMPVATAHGWRFTTGGALVRIKGVSRAQYKRLSTEFDKSMAGQKFREAYKNAYSAFEKAAKERTLFPAYSLAKFFSAFEKAAKERHEVTNGHAREKYVAMLDAQIEYLKRFRDFATRKGAYKTTLSLIQDQINALAQLRGGVPCFVEKKGLAPEGSGTKFHLVSCILFFIVL